MLSRHAGTYPRALRVPQEKTRGRAGSGEQGKKKIARPGKEGLRGGGGEVARSVPRPEEPGPAPMAPIDVEPKEPAKDAGERTPPPPRAALAADGGEDGQRIDGDRLPALPVHEYPRPEGGPDAETLDEDPGAETRLHAKRFEPAAFWSDVRRKIQEEWEKRALVVVKQLDPLEDTYFYKPRTVLIRIALDAAGAIRDARVVESSRLDFYDAVALSTVRQQHYPNPPPAALGPDGAARINVRFTWVPSAALSTPRALR
jgi:TonB family protein